MGKYQDLTWEGFRSSLSQRRIIERGLIAAASVIFDIADHILASHFGLYPETYEESLQQLAEKGVLSNKLYRQIKGLVLFHKTNLLNFGNFLVRLLGLDKMTKVRLSWVIR